MRFIGAILLVLVTIAGLASCEKTAADVAIAPTPQPAYTLPTATEAFHLQSECVKLGEKITEDDFIGPALTKSQVSRYNPKTNRCYVSLTAMTADLSGPMDYFSNTLYDGQTGELLAFSKSKKGEKSESVFVNVGNLRFDNAGEYINKIMNDE